MSTKENEKVFFFFFCVELAATLVLMMSVERDNVSHCLFKHRGRRYFNYNKL